MKNKTLIVASTLFQFLGLSIVAHAQTPENINPTLEKFSSAITFYASYDQTIDADLTNGKGKGTPRDAKSDIAYQPGKWGQAFLSGLQSVSYSAAQNVDLSKPGSMAVWISPYEWQRDAQQIPGLYFVNVLDQGRQIMLSRMGENRNREAVFAYGKAGNKGLSAKNGNSSGWQNGEWHLLIVNWRNAEFEFSLDGRSVRRQEMPEFEKATGKSGQIIVGAIGRKNQQFLVDELMILNRPLATEEIQWLWEQK